MTKRVEFRKWARCLLAVSAQGCVGRSEMLLIEFAGTVNSLKFLSKPMDPYFMFVVSGQTKGTHQLMEEEFGVPCIAKMRGTGI
jgi:hypothetical protein